jgi:hypothetical protein
VPLVGAMRPTLPHCTRSKTIYDTLAAGSGASTRDLMVRMGHDSMHAALIYQHATTQADRAIARALDTQLRAPRRSSRRER